MSDDAQLLRAYSERRDETVFTALVKRYFDLVWGAGYRVTADADLARDVAQTVFTELARTAKGFPPQISLGGWLYRTAYHTAANMVRSSLRRAKRETQLMEMHSLHSQQGSEDPQIESLLPTLDEAIAQLSHTDREAIVLRFLRRKSLAEVGELKQIANLTVPELQKRIESTLMQANTEQKRADRVQAHHEAKELSEESRNTLGSLLSVVGRAAQLNNGRLPDSFEQLESMSTQWPAKIRSASTCRGC